MKGHRDWTKHQKADHFTERAGGRVNVREFHQIETAILNGGSIEILSDEESGALMALSDALDGNPLNQQLPHDDAEFVRHCASKVSSSCHIYLIDDECEKHWVSAHNEEHALVVYTETYGSTPEEFRENNSPFTISQLPDKQELPVGDFDEPEAPPVVKTCAQWASSGPGLIATTCF